MGITILSLALILLQPGRMYYQPQGPVIVNVDHQAAGKLLADGDGAMSLVMLSGAGQSQARANLGASQSQVDLSTIFTGKIVGGPNAGLWDGKTHYIQLLGGEKAIGSPLVVIPLVDPDRRGHGKPDALRILVEKHVVLNTDQGDITLSLDHESAPNTVMHFEYLVAGGFYTNVIFHRVVPGFVIQGGDPTGSGGGGPGYLLDLETSGKLHRRGTLSMARRPEPNTAGSQFFICLSRRSCASLDGKYAAFGEVVSGMEVVQKIAGGPLAGGGRPKQPVVIRSAKLVPAPPREIAQPGDKGAKGRQEK